MGAMILKNIILFFIGYIIGSFLLGQYISYFKGHKLELLGSKNVGTTNSIRVLGMKYGFTVFLCDCFKGYLACLISYFLIKNTSYFSDNIPIISGTGAVFGHCFSIFFKFKGGKGVASFLGIILFYSYIYFYITGSVFLYLNIFTKYTSLSSILTIFFITIFILFPFIKYESIYETIYFYNKLATFLIIVILAIFILIRHYKNIIKIIKSEESYSLIFKIIKE